MYACNFPYYADNQRLQKSLSRMHSKISSKELVVKSDAVQRIIVRRSNLWEDSLKQFIKGLSYNKTIKVTFVGEPAVDSGGPRREYFTLLIRAIAMNNSLFEGDTDRRLPRINVSA